MNRTQEIKGWRRRRAAELYIAGATQVAIAAELRTSQATVSRDLSRAFREDAANVSELRESELVALEAMKADAAREYVHATGQRARQGWFGLKLRVHERIARLCGLDQPARNIVTIEPDSEPDPYAGLDDRGIIVATFAEMLALGGTLAEARVMLLAGGFDRGDVEMAYTDHVGRALHAAQDRAYNEAKAAGLSDDEASERARAVELPRMLGPAPGDDEPTDATGGDDE